MKLLLTLLLLAGPAAWAADLGTVTLAGEDSWVTRGSASAVALKVGDPVQVGDQIQVGKDPMLLVLRDGTVSAAIKLKPKTRVTLTLQGQHGLVAQLDHGGILSDIHNPKKAPKPFEIRTRSATMGVRGTLFYVQEEAGKPMFLCTCIGEVAIRSGRGEMTIRSKHHDQPITLAAGSEDLHKRMQKASVGADHTDAEAGELEKALSAR